MIIPCHEAVLDYDPEHMTWFEKKFSTGGIENASSGVIGLRQGARQA